MKNLCRILFLFLLFLSVCYPRISLSKEQPAGVTLDGRFIKDATGVLKDTNTGLEWYTGPDRDTTWDEAKSWVENLTVSGGGWRMPTTEELGTLYHKGFGRRNMAPQLRTTGWWVWSGEMRSSETAYYFHFYYGVKGWYSRSKPSRNARGFAVRSRK